MEPPQEGRWVVCGYGRFGRHLAADLLRHGLAVTVVDARVDHVAGAELVHGDPVDPGVLEQARVEKAVALVAATDTDIDNLDILAGARRINDGLFLAGRQNDAANAPLFGVLDLDVTLVPTELVAREALARVSDPTLWRFLQRIGRCDDEWSDALIERIRARCGSRLPDVWVVELRGDAAAALLPHWSRTVTVGGLMCSPEDRTRVLDAVVLMIERGDDTILAPADDEPLEPGDRLLLVGMGYDRRALSTTLTLPTAAHYVLTGDRVGQSWLWRTLVDR
jgi:Trk K+ transport system NAD-binding subunit